MQGERQSYGARIQVPLALESEIEIPLGSIATVPLRSVIAAVIASIPAFAFLISNFAGIELRLALAIGIVALAIILSIPKSQGVWVGTLFFYKVFKSGFANSVQNGKAFYTHATWIDDALVTSTPKIPLFQKLPFLRPAGEVPILGDVEDGFFNADRWGHRGVLVVEGPVTALGSLTYDQWSQELMGWFTSLECPGQFLSIIEHYSPDDAIQHFDERLHPGWTGRPIIDAERRLVFNLAQQSFKLSSYLVLAPEVAKDDGTFEESNLMDWNKTYNVPLVLLQEKMAMALRTAEAFPRLKVRLATASEIGDLLKRSPIGAEKTIATKRGVQITNHNDIVYYKPLSVIKMARSLVPGDLVDLLMRSGSQGMINVTVSPVDFKVARKKIEKIRQTRTYASDKKRGGSIVDAMAIEESQIIEQSLAEGAVPFNIAISLSMFADNIERVEEATDKIDAYFKVKKFGVVVADEPGLLPMMATSLGGAPLRRSYSLTLDPVVRRLLPCLGTPFNNQSSPLVGISNFTGSPAYLDIWKQGSNHNMLVLATAGGGKSVAMKTLLFRHAIAGTNCVIIDPDNEYRGLIRLLEGNYYELGKDALNVMGVSKTLTPKASAGAIAPILAILGGAMQYDEHGNSIRRMVLEDQYWLQQRLLEFFNRFESAAREPVLHDFTSYLEAYSRQTRNEEDENRCRRIQERLSYYTQGKLADFFDKPSTFSLGKRPVGIGLKALTDEYSRDLTPAMAMVLTAIFEVMSKTRQRFLVVIDEAHHLTADPDSGAVLDSIVRRGRKSALGVWMATQKVDDFISTPLGQTLAASSAVQLILGVPDNVVDKVSDIFHLTPEEAATLFPIKPGRGVLITDSGERGVVTVVPSTSLMDIINTSAAARLAN